MISPADAGPLAGDAGERALIERIRGRLPKDPASLLVGIGDDAAVAVPPRGAFQVLTTDALVEGVHFDWRYSSAADVGFKALAVNISDIASMGGAPHLALLSLMLPASLPLSTLDGILDGLLEMAAAAGVTLAGGNITRTPGPLTIDLTVVGSVRPRKILKRGGGKPGDQLYVTGSIGAAAAGLAWLRAAGDAVGPCAGPEDADLAACVLRHRRPEPRARIGALLGRTRAASACMDVSDGLADAITQLATASGAGALIDAAQLPIAAGARAWFESRSIDPLEASLGASDDYELLFALPKKRRGRLRAVGRESRGIPLTRIGELTAERSIEITAGNGRRSLPSGFDHFS